MTGAIVALLAATTGVAEAVLLGRGARLGVRPLATLLRLLLVAAVLVAAALSGALAAGVAGWGTGYAGGVIILAWRWR